MDLQEQPPSKIPRLNNYSMRLIFLPRAAPRYHIGVKRVLRWCVQSCLWCCFDYPFCVTFGFAVALAFADLFWLRLNEIKFELSRSESELV